MKKEIENRISYNDKKRKLIKNRVLIGTKFVFLLHKNYPAKHLLTAL